MRTLLISVLFSVTLFLSACSKKDGDDSATSGAPALRVGMDLTYPPFEIVDGDGNPTGVSVDMAYAMGEHLGRPVKIKAIAFDGLIAALKTGSIDCILSSMTANDERRKSIDFSDPYIRTGLSILAGKTSGVKGIDDVNQKDRRIAVQIGTTGEMYARAEFDTAEVVSFDSTTACVMEVVNGKADAFIFDQLSVYNFSKRNPETTVGLLAPFQEEEWALGIKKGNDELREDINGFLKAFAAEGGFEKLGEKYLGEEKKLLESLGIPFLFVTGE